MKTVTIDCYTGQWQAALSPSVPRVGSYVRIHTQPDAREYDDFQRALASAGLMIGDFVRHMPRKKLDVCRIERGLCVNERV